MDYQKEWATDAEIDISNLALEALRVPLLHARWMKRFYDERLRYRKALLEFDKLKKDKWEWLSGKMVDEDRTKLGWEPQQRTLRLREDIERYLNADPDIIKAKAVIALLEETGSFLQGVIKSINDRGFTIKNAIDWQKFSMGV